MRIIEPIKVDVVQEGAGFAIVLRGTNGEDVIVVFKQMWWLDRVIWKLMRLAADYKTPAVPLAPPAANEPIVVPQEPVVENNVVQLQLTRVPFAA
jgi:hypothetical protein